MNAVAVRPMEREDWPDVQAIYLEALADGAATFETRAPDWEAWDEGHLEQPRLIATLDDLAIGWSALSPYSDRCVYNGVAEVSVYVSSSARRRGAGTQLLAQLVEASEEMGLWTLQAGIFPENEASVLLHQKHGFRIVGRREKIGRIGDEWRDVLLLERRSAKI